MLLISLAKAGDVREIQVLAVSSRDEQRHFQGQTPCKIWGILAIHEIKDKAYGSKSGFQLQ